MKETKKQKKIPVARRHLFVCRHRLFVLAPLTEVKVGGWEAAVSMMGE
jgi:hypothetical protein